MSNYLVMVQTNSNQSFIFSSPRLREQIGASFEITLLSRWVKEEAEKLLKQKPLPTSFWVSDSSGKVIVRFTDDEGAPKNLAKQLIREVTLRALTDTPGLDVTGVFIETSSDPVNPADLNRLDRAFSEYTLSRRPAAARFPQFPFLERGSESVLPASASLHDLNLIQEPLKPNDFDESSPLSLPSRVKRAFASTSRKRQVDDVKEQLAKQGKELKQEPEFDPTKLAAAFQDGEESEDAKNMLSSVGVVHIDGNGVGAIMRDLGSAHNRAQETGVCVSADEVHTDPDDALQTFIMVVNKRLDQAVKDAIALSWYDVQKLTPDTVVPIVPVLVGGDDVTVYTDGRYAIPFAEAYIRHYEELTEKDELLKQLAVVAGANEAGPLTASAGTAIVGRNFPFHIAYDLAEELVSRGKKLGKKKDTVPCSTIDFHVLRDATVLDPDDTLDEYKGRTQRPFLIGHYAEERIMAESDTSSKDWWAQILRTVAAFDGKKPDDPTQTTGDPFPRARANRIVKLLADYVKVPKDDKAVQAKCLGYVLKKNVKVFATQEQIDKDREEPDNDKRITKRCDHPVCAIRLEWTDAQKNARGTKALVDALGPLPSQVRLTDPSKDTEDCIEQVRWLLDLIDLSGNLSDGYLVSRIGKNTDDAGPQETADHPTEGGAK